MDEFDEFMEWLTNTINDKDVTASESMKEDYNMLQLKSKIEIKLFIAECLEKNKEYNFINYCHISKCMIPSTFNFREFFD